VTDADDVTVVAGQFSSTRSRSQNRKRGKTSSGRRKRVCPNGDANLREGDSTEDSEVSWKPDEEESTNESETVSETRVDRSPTQPEALERKVAAQQKRRAKTPKTEQSTSTTTSKSAAEKRERGREPMDQKQLKPFEIAHVFDEIRKNHRHITSRDVMSAIICHLGQQEADQMTDNDVMAMMRVADSNGDCKVDRDEFERFVLEEIRL
jgi:hypothetical protein